MDVTKDDALEAMWADSTRRHNERRRKENDAAWYDFHMNLCAVHSALASEHEARAQKLLEGGKP